MSAYQKRLDRRYRARCVSSEATSIFNYFDLNKSCLPFMILRQAARLLDSEVLISVIHNRLKKAVTRVWSSVKCTCHPLRLTCRSSVSCDWLLRSANGFRFSRRRD